MPRPQRSGEMWHSSMSAERGAGDGLHICRRRGLRGSPSCRTEPGGAPTGQQQGFPPWRSALSAPPFTVGVPKGQRGQRPALGHAAGGQAGLEVPTEGGPDSTSASKPPFRPAFPVEAKGGSPYLCSSFPEHQGRSPRHRSTGSCPRCSCRRRARRGWGTPCTRSRLRLGAERAVVKHLQRPWVCSRGFEALPADVLLSQQSLYAPPNALPTSGPVPVLCPLPALGDPGARHIPL